MYNFKKGLNKGWDRFVFKFLLLRIWTGGFVVHSRSVCPQRKVERSTGVHAIISSTLQVSSIGHDDLSEFLLCIYY
jgi:hypothetical protein